MNTDLKIIKEYVQNKITCDIKATVIIGDREYTFSQQKIPEIALNMVMPDDMIRMNTYSIKIKYPDENRPNVILTVPDDETVNFLFTQSEDVVQEELPDIAQGIQAVLKRMNPGAAFYKISDIQSELSKIWWFDYSTVALDDDIYNIMYLFCLNGTLVMGGFCCLQKYRKQWKPLVLQMLETIKQEEMK